MQDIDIQGIVQQALQEFVRQQKTQSEPAYKAELQEERKRREQLERRLNELVEENKRSRQAAAEAERGGRDPGRTAAAGRRQGRPGLQGGAGRDRPDGGWPAGGRGETRRTRREGVSIGICSENPEFLPARISGGSGMTSSQKPAPAGGEGIDMEKIRPGMSREEMERVRQEIVRVASQKLETRRTNGSNYFSELSERDCETGGGRRFAGPGGKPCHG